MKRGGEIASSRTMAEGDGLEELRRGRGLQPACYVGSKRLSLLDRMRVIRTDHGGADGKTVDGCRSEFCFQAFFSAKKAMGGALSL